MSGRSSWGGASAQRRIRRKISGQLLTSPRSGSAGQASHRARSEPAPRSEAVETIPVSVPLVGMVPPQPASIAVPLAGGGRFREELPHGPLRGQGSGRRPETPHRGDHHGSPAQRRRVGADTSASSGEEQPNRGIVPVTWDRLSSTRGGPSSPARWRLPSRVLPPTARLGLGAPPATSAAHRGGSWSVPSRRSRLTGGRDSGTSCPVAGSRVTTRIVFIGFPADVTSIRRPHRWGNYRSR